ncbi:conserved hypothetical protein, partial [Trichinella spiralis]
MNNFSAQQQHLLNFKITNTTSSLLRN